MDKRTFFKTLLGGVFAALIPRRATPIPGWPEDVLKGFGRKTGIRPTQQEIERLRVMASSISRDYGIRQRTNGTESPWGYHPAEQVRAGIREIDEHEKRVNDARAFEHALAPGSHRIAGCRRLEGSERERAICILRQHGINIA